MDNGSGLSHVARIYQRDDDTIQIYFLTDSFKPGQEVEVSAYLIQGIAYAAYNDKKRIPLPDPDDPGQSAVLRLELPAVELSSEEPVIVVTRVAEVWNTVLMPDIPAESVDTRIKAEWRYGDTPREPPSSAPASLAQIETAVGQSVKTSLQEVVRRPVASNVMGAVSLSRTRVSASQAELQITVKTGQQAWQAAAEAGMTAFALSGGENRDVAEFEVVVDAAGMEVTPDRSSAEITTSDGSLEWSVSVQGEGAETAQIWMTLFSSGRYIQAIKSEGITLETNDGSG
jgi:hypothetical protein